MNHSSHEALPPLAGYNASGGTYDVYRGKAGSRDSRDDGGTRAGEAIDNAMKGVADGCRGNRPVRTRVPEGRTRRDATRPLRPDGARGPRDRRQQGAGQGDGPRLRRGGRRRRHLQPARGRAQGRRRPRSSPARTSRAAHVVADMTRRDDVRRLADEARRGDGPGRHPGQQRRQQHPAADRRDRRRRLGPARRAEPELVHGADARPGPGR